MPTDVLMPPLSQTMDTLVLVEWLKAPGDTVQKGEPLFLVETDKATLEVESPATGILQTLLARPGAEIAANTRIAVIGAAETPAGQRVEAGTPAPGADGPQAPLSPERRSRIFASPRARRRAAEAQVALVNLAPSGPQQMIVERDVEAYLAQRALQSLLSPVAPRLAVEAGADPAILAEENPEQHITRSDAGAAAMQPQPDPALATLADAGEADGRPGQPSSTRRTIARRLQDHHQLTVPVTLTREIDVTELVTLRTLIVADLPAGAVHPTYTDFFIFVAARCLGRHPQLNGTYDGESLLIGDAVHLGLAVDTQRGLLVPILHDVQGLRLLAIAETRARLVAAALGGSLEPANLTGGTFTLTNLGPLHIDAFTPVLNPPQLAILGAGRIRENAAAFRGRLALRQTMVLSLTVDHRIVDGAPAARFLDDVAQVLEGPHRVWL